MAILEKEVEVLVGNRGKYYEDKGYTIPRIKDKRGRMTIKRGTQIVVKIEDLPPGSGIKVTKICDFCSNQSPNIEYGAILCRRIKGDGRDRCVDCGKGKSYVTRLNKPIPVEKSLYNFAISNNKEYLINEYSIQNTKSIHKVSYGSEIILMWICSICKSKFNMSANKRTCGDRCPYCRGLKVNTTNSLISKRPDIAKLLKNPTIGKEVTVGSNKTTMFKCDKCGHCKPAIVSQVVKQGLSCPKCGDGVSYPEKFIFSLLQQINVDFETQKRFNWGCGKFYDFYLPSHKLIIEAHGIQHYEETNRGRSLKDENENDKVKRVNAYNSEEINHYFVIDCRYSNLEWIKNSILLSNLSKILGFHEEDIDWDECDVNASHSLIFEAAKLWKSGIENALKISEILKVSHSTTVTYLNKARELSLCNYNPQEKWKVVQIDKENNNYVKVWKSASEAERNLRISKGSVGRVCKGERVSTGGCKWMYKEDYDKMIEKNT